MRDKKQQKDKWNKGFTDGFWYAVQQIAIYCNRNDAVFLIHESGITADELTKSQEENGYETELMNEIIIEAFKEQI